MAILLLTFVGNQDPYSDITHQPGSIVSLVSHLQEQRQQIRGALLLYTAGTHQNAIDTKDWLLSESGLTDGEIELVAVSETLSDDPVNSLLAVQAAQRAVEQARLRHPDASLAFNASSGTPAMKTAWSILQAAGYAPNSQVWQVRNPQEIRAGQERVFQTNVGFLKREFDLKVAGQQVQDYNYSGALITLESNGLLTDEIAALLRYGYYRMARDFDRAFSSLSVVQDRIDRRWVQEIAQLRQRQKKAQLQEAYFNALIRLKNRKYADFLIELFGLQENLLRWLVQQSTGLELSGDRLQSAQMWAQIKQVDQGKLFRHLQNYRLPRGDKLRLEESISRYVMIAILDYFPALASVMPAIQDLNDYCNLRNKSVHEFAGVSEIQEEDRLMAILSNLMKKTSQIPDQNPFDQLNDQICEQLNRAFSDNRNYG